MPGSFPSFVLSVPDVPLALGALLALSLAAPPGPANALIAQEAARRGWSAGLVTGLGAIVADLIMFSLMWLGALRLIAAVPGLLVVLGAIGTALMLWYARGAFLAARHPARAKADARGGFAKSFFAIMTSPFNYAWWLSAGTTVFATIGPGMIVGFFGGLLVWIAGWSALTAIGGVRIRRFSEIVGYASAIVLFAFAVVIALATIQEARGFLA